MTDMRDVFDTGSFDAVLEKATLDALLAAEPSPWSLSAEAEAATSSALGEISRVLRPVGGTFVSVTFSQPHFRLPLLAREDYGWDVDTRLIRTGEEEDSLPFYSFVATR